MNNPIPNEPQSVDAWVKVNNRNKETNPTNLSLHRSLFIRFGSQFRTIQIHIPNAWNFSRSVEIANFL